MATNKAPRVTVIERDESECSARYKDCDINVSRPADDRNWYIRVTDAGGYGLYNGYWSDSVGNTMDEALQEACRGSLLWPAT